MDPTNSTYPECSCNPWNATFSPSGLKDTQFENDTTWYAPQRYDYARCYSSQKFIDSMTKGLNFSLSALSAIQKSSKGFRCVEDYKSTKTGDPSQFVDYFSSEFTNFTASVEVLK